MKSTRSFLSIVCLFLVTLTAAPRQTSAGWSPGDAYKTFTECHNKTIQLKYGRGIWNFRNAICVLNAAGNVWQLFYER
jgi:hypothetical protein